VTKIRPSGGYRDTASFQTATIIYDATYWFCGKFLDPRSRTVDQMVQAARSGRQNIAEGSRAAATSSQTELRLLNVARSSLEELLLDFEDYLRHRHLPQWALDSSEALAVRRVAVGFRKDQSDRSDQSDQSDQNRSTNQKQKDHWAFYAQWLEHNDPSVRANALICLINQANYLLDQQIAALEKQFIEEGGYSEQLAVARLAARSQKKKIDRTDRTDPTDQTDQKLNASNRADQKSSIPPCPLCGGLMVLRTARSGKNSGKQFLGCFAYPECKGVVKL
jgi:restriction system protein